MFVSGSKSGQVIISHRIRAMHTVFSWPPRRQEETSRQKNSAAVQYKAYNKYRTHRKHSKYRKESKDASITQWTVLREMG